MKLSRIAFFAGISLSLGGLVYGYQHFARKSDAIAPSNTAAVQSTPAIAPPPQPAEEPLPEKFVGSRASMEAMLDHVIEDAIARGTLNISSLTPAQLALLPNKFKARANTASERDSVSDEEYAANMEAMIAASQPEKPLESQQAPCPEPGHLPEAWNNEFNKAALRARGCHL